MTNALSIFRSQRSKPIKLKGSSERAITSSKVTVEEPDREREISQTRLDGERDGEKEGEMAV